ncbi:hypothetical protein SPF06_04010 [Sinomonas sp. JGH33]|uniref:Allophanate hydrolase n=1 Tax=Sinomonas terricola TaxID=3110330 RepID=A0ABU5T2J8_9MICC|nr:hypothetical protein [Sinomonas sp. JGH33]MEA5453879.1 hypothetical protein [Sinomonas sp. JGH33]
MSSISSSAKPTVRTGRSYWLAISAIYGISLGFMAVADRVWLWAVLPGFVLGLVVLARLYGQLQAWVQGRSVPAWIGILAFILGVAATQIHASGLAIWLGPIFAAAALGALFVLLDRFGKFDDHGSSHDPS